MIGQPFLAGTCGLITWALIKVLCMQYYFVSIDLTPNTKNDLNGSGLHSERDQKKGYFLNSTPPKRHKGNLLIESHR